MTQTNHKAAQSQVAPPRQLIRVLGRWMLPIAAIALIASTLGLIIVRQQSHAFNTVVPLGSSIHLGFGTVTVHSVRYDASLLPGLVLPDQMEVLTLDVEIANTGSSAIAFYPSTQSFLRDAQGDEWHITPSLLHYPFPSGNIAPGKTVRGEISYLVAKHTTGVWWYADRLVGNAAPVAFEIVPAAKT